MMVRKIFLILLGAAAGVAVTLIATHPRIALDGARAQASAADTYRQLSLFGDVFERVRAHYVEKPDDSKLIESAISSMLAGLDPHSSYMDSKSFRDLQAQTRGEFGGLGIEVIINDGLIKVVTPIDDTPAAKERRLGLGLRNRRGRTPGSRARDGDRDALIRQGVGADHHSPRFRQMTKALSLSPP
jgi:carboxyl-terminal processing protease